MEQNRLGKRINEVRRDRCLTAEKLSELCNINATYLRQIEGGSKVPSLPVFIDICKALHISPNYLLQDELGENEISKIQEIEKLVIDGDSWWYILGDDGIYYRVNIAENESALFIRTGDKIKIFYAETENQKIRSMISWEKE